ncbi:MAG: SUMF1/EgtB/PvdO family nonheme iron enzyme [Burkholderiales bacterium]|nr:SUMF1/EgtB/PvdO family nonheme iron enzyme [Opitutaceae bacterium]
MPLLFHLLWGRLVTAVVTIFVTLGGFWASALAAPAVSNVSAAQRVTASTAPAGFVLIPAGAFQMGDNFADSFGFGEDWPVHTVTLSAFYVATTETTKAKWDEVRAWGLANGYTDLYAGEGKAANHPVQEISWADVIKWSNAASERDGLVPVYRTGVGAVHRTGTIIPVINYANNG